MSVAIFDAGGAAPVCQLLALATRILGDPPDRRPRGRRLGTLSATREAHRLHDVLMSAEVALQMLYYALHAGLSREGAAMAIARDGIDPVARTVLDAGGHIAAAQFEAALRTPTAGRNLLDPE